MLPGGTLAPGLPWRRMRILELLTAHSRDDLRPSTTTSPCHTTAGSDGGYARYQLTHRTVDALPDPPPRRLCLPRHEASSDITNRCLLITQPKVPWCPNGVGSWPTNGLRQALAVRAVWMKAIGTSLQRLWAEGPGLPGLTTKGNPRRHPDLGAHTLVLADHNGAFSPTRKPTSATRKAAWP